MAALTEANLHSVVGIDRVVVAVTATGIAKAVVAMAAVAMVVVVMVVEEEEDRSQAATADLAVEVMHHVVEDGVKVMATNKAATVAILDSHQTIEDINL